VTRDQALDKLDHAGMLLGLVEALADADGLGDAGAGVGLLVADVRADLAAVGKVLRADGADHAQAAKHVGRG